MLSGGYLRYVVAPAFERSMVTEPADQLSDNALFLLRRAEASVRAAADDLLAPTLLTLSQYFVLRLIRSTPGSSSADLARLYGVSPRAMTGLLSTLESVGLPACSCVPRREVLAQRSSQFWTAS